MFVRNSFAPRAVEDVYDHSLSHRANCDQEQESLVGITFLLVMSGCPPEIVE